MGRPAKKDKYYIDKSEFLDEMKAYKARGNVASNKLSNMILLLCEKVSHHPWFRNYPFRDDMVGDAIMLCCAALPKFDSDKYDNPFGYFSRVAWNGMRMKINKERKALSAKIELTETHNQMNTMVPTIDGEYYNIQVKQTDKSKGYLE